MAENGKNASSGRHAADIHGLRPFLLSGLVEQMQRHDAA
jgi:hypothetical protein